MGCSQAGSKAFPANQMATAEAGGSQESADRSGSSEKLWLREKSIPHALSKRIISFGSCAISIIVAGKSKYMNEDWALVRKALHSILMNCKKHACETEYFGRWSWKRDNERSLESLVFVWERGKNFLFRIFILLTSGFAIYTIDQLVSLKLSLPLSVLELLWFSSSLPKHFYLRYFLHSIICILYNNTELSQLFFDNPFSDISVFRVPPSSCSSQSS